MKFKFAALSINSMPMSTMMALRRVRAPAKPMAKSSAERRRSHASGVTCTSWNYENGGQRTEDRWAFPRTVSHSAFAILHCGCSFALLFVHRDDHGANQRSGQQQADHFKRQNEFVHQLVADLTDGYFRRWSNLSRQGPARQN